MGTAIIFTNRLQYTALFAHLCFYGHLYTQGSGIWTVVYKNLFSAFQFFCGFDQIPAAVQYNFPQDFIFMFPWVSTSVIFY